MSNKHAKNEGFKYNIKAKNIYRKNKRILVLLIIFIILSLINKNTIIRYTGLGISIILVLMFFITRNKKNNNDDVLLYIKKNIKNIADIVEKDSQTYAEKYNLIMFNIRELKTSIKKHHKYLNYSSKIELIKYIQNFIKKFYNDEYRQIFFEEILDDVLNYISLYDSKYIREIKFDNYRNQAEKIVLPEVIIYQGQKRIYVASINHSLLKEKSILKDLFSYPLRNTDIISRNGVLSKNMLHEAPNIINELFKINEISFVNELIQVLNDANSRYCKNIMYEFMKILNLDKKDFRLEQIKLLLKWSDYIKYENLYIEILETSISNNKLIFTDEMLKLLYDYNTCFFNKVFNKFIIKSNRKYFNKQQKELLEKWSNISDNEKFNKFTLRNKSKNLSDKEKNYINNLANDIIKNKNKIENCINVISDKQNLYYIMETIIENTNNETDEEIDVLYSIINDTNILEKVPFYKFLNDLNLLNKLINMLREKNKISNNAVLTFYSMFNLFIKNGNRNKALELINKIIEEKPIYANLLIKKIILNIEIKKVPKYIHQIVEYANLMNIDAAITHSEKKEKDLSYKEAYNKIIMFNNFKNYNNSNLSNYILNIDSKISYNECCIIDKQINDLFKHKLKGDELEFEKVIEFIINNKDFFILENSNNMFNYAKWFFECIEKIETHEVVKKIINNKIIINDLYNNIKSNDLYNCKLIYKNSYKKIDLKDHLINIYILKYYDKDIVNLVLKFSKKLKIKQEKKEFIKTIELTEQCYNDSNYNTLEKIKKLHRTIIDTIKDLKGEFYENKYIPSFSFYNPNPIYLLFIVKTFKKNYEFISRILNTYFIEEKDFSSFNVVIYEIFKEFGIEAIKKVVKFDNTAKKQYFENESLIVELITKISSYMTKDDTIIMLKFLLDNIDTDESKYKLLKKLLFSTKYREIISLKEILFIKSEITSFKNEEYIKELIHKCELIEKKL